MENTLPGVLDRVKAAFMDGIVIVLMMVAAKYAFSGFENVNDTFRAAVFIFIFVIYDPLFTSLFGGTLGHAANGICVKQDINHGKNINFLFALLRFATKFLLGWISLLTISTNDKRKAIHDHLVGSMVLYRK